MTTAAINCNCGGRITTHSLPTTGVIGVSDGDGAADDDSSAEQAAHDGRTADGPTVPGETEPDGFAGPRVVIGLYVVLVSVGGVGGSLVATFVSNLSRPELFGFLPLPATTLGFTLFGAITVAVVLGVPLSLVVTVSRRLE